MYCKRCGKKLDVEDRFCSFCGSPVEKKETLEHTVSDLDLKEETELAYKKVNSLQKDRFDEEWEREERREKFTFMILGMLIVVLIVAITGGVLFVLQKEGEKSFVNDTHIRDEVKNELDQSQKKDETEVVVTPELFLPNENSTGSGSEIGFEENLGEEEDDISKEDAFDDDTIEVSEFVIYDSDVRYLVSADLNGLTEWEIRVARNEIFARHGRMFDSPELREHFESKSWYIPTIPAVEFNNSCLSNVELENLNFIINYEKAHNLN